MEFPDPVAHPDLQDHPDFLEDMADQLVVSTLPEEPCMPSGNSVNVKRAPLMPTINTDITKLQRRPKLTLRKCSEFMRMLKV